MHRRCIGIRMAKSISTLFLITGLILNVTVAARMQTVSSTAQQTRGLMPVPASVNWKAGRLALTKGFNVALTGQTDDRLRDYVFRAMRRLERRTVIELPRDLSTDAANAALVIETRSTGNAIPKLGDDESYSI